MIWRKFSLVRENFSLFHTVAAGSALCKSKKSAATQIFFSSNRFRIKLFNEKFDFTNYLRQNGGSKISKFTHSTGLWSVKFRYFHCLIWQTFESIYRNTLFLHRNDFTKESLFTSFKHKNIASTKLFWKKLGQY